MLNFSKRHREGTVAAAGAGSGGEASAAPPLLPPAPARTATLSESSFLGSYSIDAAAAPLGRGSFSLVVPCTHRASGERRAAKVIDGRRFRLAPSYGTAAGAGAGAGAGGGAGGGSRTERTRTLLDEVRILRALEGHPNVIRVYEVFNCEDSGADRVAGAAGAGAGAAGAGAGAGGELTQLLRDSVVIVTEVATGGELFESIISAGNFSEPQARHVVFQALSALAHLHARGVVHRDIKPENLLVFGSDFVPADDQIVRPGRAYPQTRAEAEAVVAAGAASPHVPMLRVKLADFGVARYVGSAAHAAGASTFVGSPQYVAPEVLLLHGPGGGSASAGGVPRGAGYGKAVDVYSLGVVLFVMLAGYLPFDEGAPLLPDALARLQALAQEAGGRAPSWEERVKHGIFSFAPPVWTHVSEDAKACIRAMMASDPRARVSATQAMALSWFAPLLRAKEEAAAGAAAAPAAAAAAAAPAVSAPHSTASAEDEEAAPMDIAGTISAGGRGGGGAAGALSVGPLFWPLPGPLSDPRDFAPRLPLEPLGAAPSEEEQQFAVALHSVVRSVNLDHFLDLQRQLAAIFSASYGRTASLEGKALVPFAAGEVRRFSTHVRDQLISNRFTFERCRALAEAVLGLLPSLTDSVRDGDALLAKGIFDRLRQWVLEAREQARAAHAEFAALICGADCSFDRARKEHDGSSSPADCIVGPCAGSEGMRFKGEMDKMIGRIEELLLSSKSFWRSIEVLLGTQREEHVETLVSFTTSARGRERAIASIAQLARFWRAFAFVCDRSAAIMEAEAVERYSWLHT